MTQINTSISEQLHELLSQMSEATGISKSGLVAEYVRRGLLEDAARQDIVLKFQQNLKAQQKKPR
ncbi:hypothetical protein NDI44_27260 [Trichocoleus sp. DQ-A3]|uniref:hypothetical protein n=1 Tax=Coleofasciculus sp. FACHB-125 TaxID=2692784 RepID=UPI001684FDC5|nr:hypothetical protein [Coleofasciculus sp. FACHB-125]MBD1903886.1 hypothetical protein [Coleofasciculus sp. FACHB-125]